MNLFGFSSSSVRLVGFRWYQLSVAAHAAELSMLIDFLSLFINLYNEKRSSDNILSLMVQLNTNLLLRASGKDFVIKETYEWRLLEVH